MDEAFGGQKIISFQYSVEVSPMQSDSDTHEHELRPFYDDIMISKQIGAFESLHRKAVTE